MAMQMKEKTKNYPLPNERKWLRIGMEPIKPSLDPRLPSMLITAVVAERSDGVCFRVDGALRLDKIQLLPTAKDGAMVGLGLANDLLVKLESYRNCECNNNRPCKNHGGGAPN